MDAIEVDERDSTWEDHRPRFRVYLQEPSGDALATQTFDLTGADALQAIDWAQRQASSSGMLWALALVGTDDRGLRGLTWLVGMDANDPPSDEHEVSVTERMRTRASTPVVVPRADGWRP